MSEVATDILVIGAGPAGIAAAVTAAEQGRRVCLIDQQPVPGGQVWRGEWENPSDPLAQRWFERLRNSNVVFLASTRAVVAPSAGVVVCDGPIPRRISFQQLVLAVGARELLLPFPGWTLPGVMGLGGLQVLAKDGWPVAGRKVVVAGSGPLLLAVAATLRKAGAQVLALVEQASLLQLVQFGTALWRFPELVKQAAALRASMWDVPYLTGHWISAAHGQAALERVSVTNAVGEHREVPCDYLACGYGLVPNREPAALFAAAGGEPPLEIGECTGIGGMRRALAEGEAAGYRIAGATPPAAVQRRQQRWQAYADHLQRHFALRQEVKLLATPETLICRCENVPYSALFGLSGFREAKLATRLGMGNCQGRVCGAACQTLFGWEVSNSRAPLYPTPIRSLLTNRPELHERPADASLAD